MRQSQTVPTSLRITLFIMTMVIPLLMPATGKADAAFQTAKLSIPAFSSVYKIKKSGLTIGESVRTLKLSPANKHVFESVTRPTGVGRLLTGGQIVERSEWQFSSGKLMPLQYTYFDSSGNNDRNVRISFNWDKGTVTNIINGEPWKMALANNTQDKLLYQIRLMQDLSQGVRSLNYPVADGGKLKNYKLEFFGHERVKTEYGEFDTLRIRRIHDNRKTTFWCAQSLNYLPVRIEQRYENNSPIIAILVSVTGIR